MARMIPPRDLKPYPFKGNIYNESQLDGLVRKVVYGVIRNLPKDNYYLVTSILKKIRSRSSSSKYLEDLPQNFFSIAENEISFEKPSVCITHDIDSIKCFNRLEDTLNVNKGAGANATIHFLTSADYNLDLIDFDAIKIDGNVIGLHGDHHDIAIGYRSPKQFEKRIDSCLSRLPISDYKTFRAPGFGMCVEKLDILQDFGFNLDTSATSGFLFNREMRFGILQHQQLSKLRIKVATVNYSDDRVIRELGAPIALQKKFMDLILLESIRMKSTAIFNFHPGISTQEIKQYEEIITHFSTRSALFRTLSEIM